MNGLEIEINGHQAEPRPTQSMNYQRAVKDFSLMHDGLILELQCAPVPFQSVPRTREGCRSSFQCVSVRCNVLRLWAHGLRSGEPDGAATWAKPSGRRLP
jgi:hypothetical protein